MRSFSSSQVATLQGYAIVEPAPDAKVGQRGPRWPEVQVDNPLAAPVGDGPRRPTLNNRVALATLFFFFVAIGQAAADDFARTIRPLLTRYCFDCHYDGEKPEGDFNLERFQAHDDVLRQRELWRAVFDKIETRQMPPPKEPQQPTDAEREQIQAYITRLAGASDPFLGVRDPGQPTLRRLTRLEYNNTVRDLLALDTDVFIFAERLPLANKRYFAPAAATMGREVDVPLREYGQKYPVLLPQGGLPGDNRAEHGYRNRGDANNLSSATLEKYIELAGEIVRHPDLPQRSAVFAELLGLDPTEVPSRPASLPPGAKPPMLAAADGVFAPKDNVHRAAMGNAIALDVLREQVLAAYAEGRGGVFDVADNYKNQTIAGKGGLIRVPFGDQQLTINPDADVWLVGFATAKTTSGFNLLTNKRKGAKRFELTFRIEEAEAGEGIVRLGVCVLGRANQQGNVTLTATFADGSSTALAAAISPGPDGNTYFSFAAPAGTTIRKLLVDGAEFSGDYVLLDDLGFVTNGSPQAISPLREPPLPVASDEPVRPAAPSAAFVAAPPRARLEKFLTRAFRRPPAVEDLNRFFSLYEDAIAPGGSPDDAMRLTAQAVLASPSFLLLAPAGGERTAAVRRLDDFELAARLSYFLWASMPDDELLSQAAAGRLHDEAVLEAQTRRMLRDLRSRELSESFAVQWLRLDQLYTAKPDRDLFKGFYAGPQGKSTLHGAMLVEALLLFETVHVEDRSILDFIAADYTWLNPGLAKLYGLDFALHASTNEPAAAANAASTRELPAAVKSANAWQRVALTGGERGGYLTMAAPLTITSLPFRTSPVKRGAWMLETLFNRPPTEPKVAFTIANDTKEEASLHSVRERFEAHRNQAACYSCHIRLDPPGFALEVFDPIGALRERDGQSLIDAKGQWQGAGFNGPAEFKSLIASHPHEFTRGFIEHLLSYALSRRLELHDLPTVNSIQQSVETKGYQFSRVVIEVVKSYPFQHVRGPSPAGK